MQLVTIDCDQDVLNALLGPLCTHPLPAPVSVLLQRGGSVTGCKCWLACRRLCFNDIELSCRLAASPSRYRLAGRGGAGQAQIAWHLLSATRTPGRKMLPCPISSIFSCSVYLLLCQQICKLDCPFNCFSYFYCNT